MAEKPRIGYWDIRGLAAPLRLIMAYSGVDFSDDRYAVGPPPEYNRDVWFSVKFTLGLDFPNLPYYIDDKVKLTETNAIFRYLGRKYNLYGDDDVAKANCDLILEMAMGLRNGFVGLCYGKNFDENKPAYLEKAKKQLDAFEAYLGDKKFFAGDKVTVADFHMFEMLDQHNTFEPSLLDNSPKLKQFWQRFRDLPAIKAYLSSDKYKERPINNPSANWK
ncbi:glutathione S-transferase Mu 3 [Aplysia californica]|uniref:glutathione transferase n=1 Tax=Aplysia californica TaxID=6500 RepID=A0ABM1AAZ4_APLCA|nr:glutathione S-transferase Mu 3 [Aplysia californica]